MIFSFLFFILRHVCALLHIITQNMYVCCVGNENLIEGKNHALSFYVFRCANFVIHKIAIKTSNRLDEAETMNT